MIQIAIDGPSGAGKSTLARIAAREFGFLYVDTGALYRAIGFAALRAGVSPHDETGVHGLLPSLRLSLRHADDGQHVFIGDEDVSASIRSPEVSMAASAVSALPAVRAFLLNQQRDIAAAYDVVMDGRDIGTVVLPHATLKIFLTATPEDRARRRYDELREKGAEVSFESVLNDMIQRDHDDATRAAAPLKAAPDAVLVDTTGNTLEQSAEILIRLIQEHISA